MNIVSRRKFLAMVALLFALIPQLSAEERVKRPTAAAEVWGRTELYFGTNISTGGEVTDDQFNNFVATEATKRFPDGLTVLSGRGQFTNSAGIVVREKAHVMILLYPPQMLDANKKIQELRQLYKDVFAQESVLRVDSFSFVSF